MPRNLAWIAASLLLTVVASAANAYTGDRTTAVPGTVRFSDVGCTISPVSGCLDDEGTKQDFAAGTVKFSTDGPGGHFSFVVGNDRDDDGAVSNADADGSSDATDEDGDDVGTACNDEPARSGCFDDEMESATGDVDSSFSLTFDFCFTRDRDAYGGDWDRFTVIVASNIEGAYAGAIDVELDATSGASFPNPCFNRSGHADSSGSFGGDATPRQEGPIETPDELPEAGTDEAVYAYEPVVITKGAGSDPVLSQTQDGCSVASSSSTAMRVECTPDPQDGVTWKCQNPGLVSYASAGSVTGRTWCTGGPAAVATATASTQPYKWKMQAGVWDFAWVCEAAFTDASSAGRVLCDAPDPPLLPLLLLP